MYIYIERERKRERERENIEALRVSTADVCGFTICDSPATAAITKM